MTLSKLRKALATLPRTLDDTYARILCDIDEENQQYALHILQWLAFSARPLRLIEVSEVVAIDVNDTPQFDPQRRLQDLGDVVGICSSLITVMHRMSDEDDELGHSDSEFYESYVALAHSSVKEYLISEIIRQGQAFKYSLDETEGHVSLAKDCVAYLLRFDKVGSITSDVFAKYPLARYAATYLSEHARVAEKEDKRVCHDLLITKGEALMNMIRLHDLQSPFRLNLTGSPRHTASPLYYASVAGLLESVRTIIDRMAEFNVQDQDYGNALIAASSQGYIEIVKLLLEKSVHRTMSSCYVTALRLALFRGHTEIAQMLRGKGVDVNEPADDALLAAIREHDEEKAQFLIGNGANIARKDHAQMNSLEFASHEGLQEVVKFILHRHVNVEGENYNQALVEASREGHEPIVQILLDKGAAISAEAMGAALGGNSIEVLQTLLDHGGDIGDPRVRDAQGRSLCHHAANQNSIAKLEMLVMLGSDLTVTDKQGRNCLHHAVSNCIYKPKAVTWLLERGFDPNTPDRDGWTPLHWAAKCRYRRLGSQSTTKTLEHAGAKFSIEGIMGWNPNDVAVFHNHKISWSRNSALSRNIRRPKPIPEDGTFTTSSKANARGLAPSAFPREIHWDQACDGCTFVGNQGIVSSFLCMRLITCTDKWQPIYGPRYRCLTCLDFGEYFDYCFKCKQSSDDTHPGHLFILVPKKHSSEIA